MKTIFKLLASGALGGSTLIDNVLLGTLSDPASGGSTVNKTTTWIMMESRPIAQTLKAFKVYCTVGGNLKLKLITPANGGFAITDLQTLVCGVGLNTFTVAGGTLNQVTIPANALIGFHTPSSGGATVSFTSDSTAYNQGYLAMNGDASGANVITTSTAYKDQLQTQYTTSFVRAALPTYYINESFSGSVQPAWGVNNATTPWTFSAGKMVNAATGLTNFFDFFPTCNFNDKFAEFTFKFTAAGDIFGLYFKPILNDAGSLTGTIAGVDLDLNRIIIYASWAGGTTYTLPAVQSTKTLTAFTLTTGVSYTATLRKSGKQLSITISNGSTSETLTVDNDPTKVSGLGYGRPGCAWLAGGTGREVTGFKFGSTNTSPNFLILGDSITEGSLATDEDTQGFAALCVANGNGLYDGEGGSVALNCLKRLRHDLRLITPRYVVIAIGANNSSSDVLTTAYQTDIVNIRNTILNAGATPFICTITPNSDSTRNARVQTMNTFLLAQSGWRLIRADIALSVGGDGTTYDATKMGDSIHPNTSGHNSWYQRIKLDAPELGIS